MNSLVEAVMNLIGEIAKAANASEAELMAKVADEAQRKAFASDAAWKRHLENLEAK